MQRISIVIPIFNEAGLIKLLIPALEERLVACLDGYELEILLVDDGSSDGSFDLLVEATAGMPHYCIIRLSRNFGHQIAITAGMAEATGDAVVVMDADLQDPPEVVLEFVKKWQEGYHVVYGVRESREGESAFKLLTAKLFYRALRSLTNVDIPADVGDFRLIDRKICDVYNEMREKDPYVRGLISWAGFNQVGVRYARDARAAGTTKYPIRKMVKFAIDGITSFSTIPLRLCTVAGSVLSVFSFLGILYFLYLKLIARDIIDGLAATAIIVLFMGGIQLLGLGIIGEYLARIFHESKGRPVYIVQDRVQARETA
ncbi:MAG: glycosyltransferase family 2 protein [Verrucomicrobia bacterium]|nr:glycosyltransferase family 2 protein [Verrucomicrobiota bacterium]MDA1086877.1 glycosyltransferase family 2 protein [Verrucomicrobiota bacterium]